MEVFWIQLDSLEFAWNMPRFTLHVDARYNVIRRTPYRLCLPLRFTYVHVVSSKFRTLFDSGRWLLLPETSIIDIYRDVITKGQKFHIVGNPVYRYTLLARPDMLLVPIHCQNSLPADEDMPPRDFTLYTYPYPDFPRLLHGMSILA
ncbi:hypothetical protein M413DRAFT_322138 [Hebeloma cylindrosporum]|uniref:Uncharacterized protein n=1 Tax=Hebeloma cylindrosporum TaxID=76867 RepID=A0A0C3BXG5_HEBCY|nr:hypothetical protein M413DRAFT_322138 [Hebeloma cylindrosporum h7]